MKISAKTEYACIAMLELATSHETGEPIRIRKIADQHQIPQRFLVQILLQLKGAGLVVSTRGAAGGYQLSRPPEEITLGEVISVIEGPQEACFTSGRPSSPAVQALAGVWREIGSIERDMLSQISFSDLAKRSRGAVQDMYYI